MKIGIIKETKSPVDNRVPLTPTQIAKLQDEFKNVEFVVESSNIRAYHDDEYSNLGIEVKTDISDADLMFGIKEVSTEYLISNKHYFFFGHIAKKQPYNQPLIKKMIEKKITFTDYEYLVDENNNRLCAFGWWAGVVGAYNTLRAFGIKENIFTLPKPDIKFTLDKLLTYSNEFKTYSCKIIVSGNGRSSHGVQYVLDNIGFIKVSNDVFLKNKSQDSKIYTVAYLDTLVKRKDNKQIFDREHFNLNPELYVSDFYKYAKVADVFIPCHFWGQNDPIYLSENDLQKNDINITVIGDVTCDISGSIKSTVRASTHNEPFYDYNPKTMQEEKSFSSPNNITVMAVDTLPNALAIDTSRYFGEALIKHIIEDVLNNMKISNVVDRATILRDGKLTNRFTYLKEYANK